MTIDKAHIRLLIIEDSDDDALLLVRMIKKSGFNLEYTICDNLEQLKTELNTDSYNFIISDYDLKGFTGIEAFEVYRNTGKDIPFIIVSGVIGEELAVDAMRRGVKDYLIKDRLERLIPAIRRELDEAAIRKEQAETRRALEFERHKFQLLVESAPIGIAIISVKGEIEYGNFKLEEISGYRMTELQTVPQVITKLFPDKNDRQWMLDFWHNQFNPQQVLQDIDFPMIMSGDGSPKFVKIKTAPISNDAFIVMAEDITSQKIAAITLEKNQKRLAKIIDTVEDIIIEIIVEDQKYIIGNVNKSFLESTGFYKMEVIDYQIEDVFSTSSEIKSYVQEAIKCKTTVNYECQVESRNGKRHWELFVAPIYTDNGNLYRVILNGRDFTERKKQEIKLSNSEKKFRIVSSIVSDAIWEWSSETGYIKWNEGITTLFGHERNKLGHSIDWVLNNVHFSDREYVKDGIFSSINKRKEYWSKEFRFRCSDNSYKHVNTMVCILYSLNTKPLKVIGAMIDLTHRLKAEELRIQSLVEGADTERKIIAEELHDNLGQNLSLSSILLDQLSQNYKDKKIEKVSDIIKKSIEETRNLAHSLMPKSIGDFGLKAAILSLLNSIQLMHPFHINTHFNFENERFTSKIETNLFRIFQESINNIIKHANPNSIFIQMIKSENMLSLTIEDDGVGFDIKKSNLKYGIGLKNIENRVYYLNGKLIIDSKPGKGTLLLIELPLD